MLILAGILRRYRIDTDRDHTPKTVGRVTIRSDNGIRIRLTPRQQVNTDDSGAAGNRRQVDPGQDQDALPSAQ